MQVAAARLLPPASTMLVQTTCTYEDVCFDRKNEFITFTPYHIPIHVFYKMFEKFFTLAPRSRSVDPYGGTLGMLLFNSQAKSLIRLLAIPVEPVPASTPPSDGPHLSQSARHHHHQRTPFLSLPTELYWAIF